jgi:hypothetical protein
VSASSADAAFRVVSTAYQPRKLRQVSPPFWAWPGHILSLERLMSSGIKVRLKTDLTRFHNGLAPGVEGRTTDQSGLWSRGSHRFTGVAFPGIGIFDVLWDGLEIIDEDYFAEQAKRKEEELQKRKSAKNVKRILGPKGEFKSLSYDYVNANGERRTVTTTNRNEAEILVKFFQGHGIKVSDTNETGTT